MTITALPTPPGPTDSVSVFNARAFALVAALADFVTEANAQASTVNDDAVASAASEAAAALSQIAAAASEAAANASAAAAAVSAGAALWVSGSTYALGDVVWSPVTYYTYRRIVAGAGTTDPSADAANWALAGSAAPQLVISTTTSNALLANQHIVLTNAAASTATLPATLTAGDVIWVSPGNGRTDNVIARNGHLIMGLAEDVTIDSTTATVGLRYISAGIGLRIV